MNADKTDKNCALFYRRLCAFIGGPKHFPSGATIDFGRSFRIDTGKAAQGFSSVLISASQRLCIENHGLYLSLTPKERNVSLRLCPMSSERAFPAWT